MKWTWQKATWLVIIGGVAASWYFSITTLLIFPILGSILLLMQPGKKQPASSNDIAPGQGDYDPVLLDLPVGDTGYDHDEGSNDWDTDADSGGGDTDGGGDCSD